MSSGGYTVHAGALASGNGQVSGLQVESVARGVVLAAIKQFLNADAGCQHTAAHVADDVGHGISTGLSDITGGLL